MQRPVKHTLKSVFAAFFLLISIQAVSQDEFYKVYDFFQHVNHNYTWFVFEEEGGYVLTGCDDRDRQGNFMFIVKTNYQGDTVWSKEVKLGYPYWVSCTTGIDGSKVFTVEDSIFLFDKDWNKTSLSPIDGIGHPRKVISLADGNYLFADRIASNNYTLVKVDSESHDVIWTSNQLIQDFQMNGSGFDINSILEMPDGEIVVITSNFFSTTFGPEYIGSTFFLFDSLGILSDTSLIFETFYYDTYIEDGNLISLVTGFGDPYSITTHTTDGEVIHSFSFPYQYNIFQIRKNEDRVVVVRKANGFLVEEYKDETLLWSVQSSEPISLREVIITSDGGYLGYEAPGS